MENNVATSEVQFVSIVNNDKIVKTSPQIIQKNQNKEIILKSSGFKPTILQANRNNGGAATKTIKINSDQLKNLFNESINTGVKKPIILSMDKFKTMINNPNFHINNNSVKVLQTNLNTFETKILKTYSKSTTNSSKLSEKIKSIESSSQESSNSVVSSSNIVIKQEKITESNENKLENSSSNVQISNSENSSTNSIKLNPKSTKIIKLNQNIQNEEESSLNNSTDSSSQLSTVKIDPQSTIKLTQNEKNVPIAKKMQIQVGNSTTSPEKFITIDSQSFKTIKLPNVEKNPTISPEKFITIDSQSFKPIKLSNNIQNGVEKSSTNPQKIQTVAPSSLLKTVKLNQNDQKTSPILQTLSTKNQKFFLPPNNRFRIIHQNGKQIALPIVNETTASNNISVLKTSPNNVSKPSSSIETPKVSEDNKNPFVFDSMTLPIGARKIYQRRPKTPEHVYKKLNLPIKPESSKKKEKQKKIDGYKIGDSTKVKCPSWGINKTITPTKTKVANTSSKTKVANTNIKKDNQIVANTNIKKVNQIVANTNIKKVNQIVANNVTDHANEKHDEILEKKKRISRKRNNIDDSAGNTSLTNQTANMLIQTLKSKFVPLVGHACTATIIEHLNLAYSRCRISHSQAVKELIQYIDNYERYRDRKLLDSKKQNNLIRERSTQTENESSCDCKQSSKENIVEVPSRSSIVSSSNPVSIPFNGANKQKQQKTVDTSIVSDLNNEFSMVRLRLFRDWNTALVPDVTGNMPIHNAVLENDFFAVKRLCLILKHLKNINIQNESNNMTALHLAISNKCDIEIIEYLLENGVNPEIEDINGSNCLHMIAQHGSATIMDLMLTKYRSPNLDLNTCNYDGSTPLMLCAEHDNVEIAKLLLKHKADTEVQDLKSGRTVLFQAIEGNNEPMVKLLIENGADPKKRDYGGITPLEVISEVRITPGIRKIMYKILSQNIVNLQRKRQRQHIDNIDDDLMLIPITSEYKIRKINANNDDDDDYT